MTLILPPVSTAPTLADRTDDAGRTLSGYGVVYVDAGTSALMMAAPGGRRAPMLTGGWEQARLGETFTTTSSMAQSSPLQFTPAASTTYEVRASLLLRTASAQVGARPGVQWPANPGDGSVRIRVGTGSTLETLAYSAGPVTTQANVLNMAQADVSWLGEVSGLVMAGADTSGPWRITLSASAPGTSVSLVVGSVLMWRQLA